MRHKHEHLIVEHLRVYPEVARYPLVQYMIPAIFVLFYFRSVEADPVSPKVTHLANIKIELIDARERLYMFRILDKLEVKLVEIGFNIDALVQRIDIFVDQHEVCIHFYPTVFTHNNANLIKLLGVLIVFGDRSVLDKWRDSHVCLGNHDAELHQV